MRPGDFPLQDECDLDNPREFMAWTMVATPHVKGAALLAASEAIQDTCEHFWKCGVRIPHTKEGKPRYQKQWYLPPGAGDPHWLTNPGTWTPDKQKAEDRKQKPNMVSVLRAMQKADEGGFLNALNQVMREKGQ